MWNDKNLVNILEKGGVVVMPTDTIYGIIGKAENKDTVNRIYNLKKRAPEKPCIILIGDMSELEKFAISLSFEQENKLKDFQSEPTSIILDCLNEKFEYLHRGTNTLSFRLPAQKELRELLLAVGPLVAPSANLEGLKPARNIVEAKEYFGDQVDQYIDGGQVEGKSSRLIKLHKDGTVDILRV